MLGAAEIAGTIYYVLFLTADQRRNVESAIGVNDAVDLTSVLRYRSHPYLNYVNNPEFTFENGYRPHHTIGIRKSPWLGQPKAPDSIRIVAIGGSTTYGLYFNKESNVWPMGLERLLRQQGIKAEVINASAPNYSTFELLGMMTLLVPTFSPDLVLIHTGLNDAFAVGYPDEGGPDNLSFRFQWSYEPPGEPGRTIMRWSRLARSLAFRFMPRMFSLSDMTTAMQYQVPEEKLALRFAERATGQVFERNLRTLVALTRHLGAMPFLMDMPTNPNMEQGFSAYYDQVALAIKRNNQIMKKVATETNSRFIAIHDIMREPALFRDSAHMGIEGMRVKANAAAEAILGWLEAQDVVQDS